MANAFNSVSDVGVKILILTAVIALLPESPFTGYYSLVNRIPYLQYLNWFVPLSDMFLVVESWLIVISSYYSILFGTRFVGIVKG